MRKLESIRRLASRFWNVLAFNDPEPEPRPNWTIQTVQLLFDEGIWTVKAEANGQRIDGPKAYSLEEAMGICRSVRSVLPPEVSREVRMFCECGESL